MAINLFGHGIGFRIDFVIQGAPAISAGSAGITTGRTVVNWSSSVYCYGC